MKKVCCQLSHFSHTQVRGRPVYEPSSSQKNKKQVATWKTKESGFSLKDKKEQIVADFRTEIQKHEFQADSDRRSIQELNGIIESQRREIDHTVAGDEQLRRDQQPLREQLSEQNRFLRETAQHSARILKKWEKRWLTGNMELSTANRLSIFKISRIIHAIDFIL